MLTGSVGLFGTAGSGHGNNERCAWKIRVTGNKVNLRSFHIISLSNVMFDKAFYRFP